ncbi:MAG TPA: phosphotransferase [Iamia sp.]|nr:phosphotransferase [Iamia sp.]
MANDDLATDLAAVLTERTGAPTTVEGLRRLSGGASRETWAFTAVSPDGRRDLILQRTRPGGSAGPASMEAEDALLAAAAAAGVPVPPTVVASADAGPLGPGRVTVAVPGEALGPRLVRAERSAEGRRALATQMGEALAAIHSIPPEDHPGLERRDVLDVARSGLDLLGVARPAFELGLRWLDENRPPATPDTVVHGDFRVGNLLVDGDDLTAVLDWEISHRGDPLEDLGWLCVRAWRFGGDHEVGGLADLDDLLAAYSRARGVDVDPAHVRWWTAAGTLSWGLMCAVQAHRHLDGHVRSVELATIGRRVVENEYDLLDLIGIGPAPAPSPEPTGPAEPPPPPDRHGRPTAGELLDAVRSHLAEEIAPLLEGAPAFSLRVVDRALATVQREVARAGVVPAVADEAALAAALRAGEVTPDDDLRAAVRAAVVERLRVANPKWLLPPDA